MVEVRLTSSQDTLGELLRGQREREGWGLDLMGSPLMIHSLKRLELVLDRLDTISIPEELSGAFELIRSEFPHSKVERATGEAGAATRNELLLPSNADATGERDGVVVKQIEEPWDLLEAARRCLLAEVKETMIAPTAHVASTAVISGPCIISDGATVDDFCKIKGPTYIGPRTNVWTGSLVRESMVGPDCEIGFGCEVGRTYLLGDDRVAHHDVILDSVLGRNVWMGAFIGTTNKMLNGSNVKYKKGAELVDTGLTNFGAVFGHGCAVGAGTIILPGRLIPPKMIVQASTLYTGSTAD